jgi:formylglycine-generating enzyme required for sulfatase activity
LVADFGPAPRERRIQTSTARLLFEAAAQRDQRTRALRRLGDMRRVFSVVSSIAARRARDLGHEELGVLSLFDGVRSLSEVLLASELPDHEALEITLRFFEAGIIVPGARKLPEAPASRTGAALAMSYRPLAGSVEPKPPPAPRWWLGVGALLCSGLGAVSAITYVNALERRAGAAIGAPESAASAAVLTPPPAARVCPHDMLLMAGGRFTMGSDSSATALQYARPAHSVTLDDFCLDAREVSVEAYAACVAAGACAPAHQVSNLAGAADGAAAHRSQELHSEQCNWGRLGREQHPINCVSQPQAAAYCNFRAARLPTEAEWEFAAKGPDNRRFPWGNSPPSAQNVNACGKECARWHESVGLGSEMRGTLYDQDDGYAGTAPVGSFPLGSTPEGVMDLIGNVFEWTSGGLYAYEQAPSKNPVGPPSSDSFVIRGGSFNSGTPEFGDPSLRFALAAGSYSHAVGFRCAATPVVANPAAGLRSAEPSSTRRAPPQPQND